MKWILLAFIAFSTTACVTVRSEQVGYSEEQLLLTFQKGCFESATKIFSFSLCPQPGKGYGKEEIEHCQEKLAGACLRAASDFISDLKK